MRYWLSIYPRVVLHVHRARAHAHAIADPASRHHVLCSLSKRANLEGAAAFAALAPRATRRAALEALLAFQSIYNYLDVLAEQPAAETLADVRYAHRPLACALGDGPRITTLYLRGPWVRDTGYLADLVLRCRRALAKLPSAPIVREAALASAADIAEFQAHTRPTAAPGELERWAQALSPRAPGMGWWETVAACGSSLTVHALIAAAATPRLDRASVESLEHAYGAYTSALHSMLDSLIDQDEDTRLGQPSLIALYASRQIAAEAMGEMARDAMCAVGALPHARRHAVLVAGMASMYLTAPPARMPPAAPIAAAVRAGIGALARPAMALFALRRLGVRRTASKPRAGGRTQTSRAECAGPEQPSGVVLGAG